MYFSAYSKKELAEMERGQALSVLGVSDSKGNIIQPAKCRVCGSYMLMVEMNGKYLQCPECGRIAVMHTFEDTFFKKGLV